MPDIEYISALLRHAERPACEAGQETCLRKMKAYIEKKVSECGESEARELEALQLAKVDT